VLDFEYPIPCLKVVKLYFRENETHTANALIAHNYLDYTYFDMKNKSTDSILCCSHSIKNCPHIFCEDGNQIKIIK
jgi:hypothetical protein